MNLCLDIFLDTTECKNEDKNLCAGNTYLSSSIFFSAIRACSCCVFASLCLRIEFNKNLAPIAL